MKDKRVVFMGTPEFSVPVLESLIDNTNVVLVVTKPDKQQGRGMSLSYSPIKEVALKHNIPLFQPEKIKKDYQKVLDVNPDIIITCAFGEFIPDELLKTNYESINVHASLLPKLRGGAPLHKSIIYGENQTGITIMYMSSKMDAGDIISQESINIEDTDNVGTIHDKLSLLGASLLIKTLPSIFDHTNNRIKQDESKVSFAYNISKEEEIIDFNKTSREVFNQIRGLYPYPIAHTTLEGKIIKVISSNISNSTKGTPGQITDITKEGIVVKCLDKSITLLKIKPEGKKEMLSIDFANGQGKNNLIDKILY